MKRWLRLLLRLLAVVLLVAVVTCGVLWWQSASLLAADLIQPRNDGLELPDTIPEIVDHRFRVPVAEGVELDVWVLEPRAPHPPNAADLAVLLHGVADHKRTMMPLARRFSLSGVRVALVDLRGHGESSVVPITYGVRERDDLSALLDHLESERGWPVGDVGVYGPSYGGAVALQWAGHEPRVKRVFSTAAFASMHRIVRPYIEHTWKRVAFAIPDDMADQVVDAAGKEAGFDPRLASGLAMLPRTHARHVLVHSTEDEMVPYQHAVDLVAACGDPCRLVTLEGKTHLQSMSNVPLRLESYQLIIGEPFPGDATLNARYEVRENVHLRGVDHALSSQRPASPIVIDVQNDLDRPIFLEVTAAVLIQGERRVPVRIERVSAHVPSEPSVLRAGEATPRALGAPIEVGPRGTLRVFLDVVPRVEDVSWSGTWEARVRARTGDQSRVDQSRVVHSTLRYVDRQPLDSGLTNADR